MKEIKRPIIRNRVILKLLFAVILSWCSFCIFSHDAFAAKTIIVSKRTATIAEEDSDFDEPNYKKVKFSLSKKQYIKLKITASSQTGDIEYRVKLFDSDGNQYSNDKVYEYINPDESITDYFYPDDYIKLPKGDYYFKISNLDEFDYLDITYSLVGYDSVATSAKIAEKKSVYAGDAVKIGTLPKSQFAKIKGLTVSDTKILKSWYLSDDGKIYVFGWKSGTATATVKLINGKKYKCKIKVKASDCNFFAKLTGYCTRDNYFTVKFKNVGPEDIKIYSSDAKSLDDDYKSYDRKLYLKNKKSIIIPAGKTKTVKFYVKGDTTWPDYTDHTIRYYFSHNGTKYLGSVWYDGSSYKDDGKWWTTYWSSYESSYNSWVYD